MAILNHHRSRSTRALNTLASSSNIDQEDVREDRHAKRRQAARAKFVNIAIHDSPSSPDSTSESSGRGRQGALGKAGKQATRQALAVMNTNAFSTTRLLAKLPIRRGRSRGDPTPIKPLERRPSGASMNDADDEDVERWAGRKRKRGGEVADGETVAPARDGKKRKDSASSNELKRGRRRSDEMDVDVSDEDDDVEEVASGDEVEGTGVVEDDEYLISSAPVWRLRRMRRDDLVRLYLTTSDAGSGSRRSLSKLEDLVQSWTKNELVDALVASREHAEPATHSGSTRSSSLVRTPTPPRGLTRTKSRSRRTKAPTPPVSQSSQGHDTGVDEEEDDDEERAEPEDRPTPIQEHKGRNRGLTRSTTFAVNFSPRRTRSGRDISGLGRSQSMNDVTAVQPRKSRSGLRRTGSVRIQSGSSQTEDNADIRARLRTRAASKSTEERASNRPNPALRRTRFFRNAKEKIGNLAEVSEDDELEAQDDDHEVGDEEDAEDEDDTPRNARRPVRQSRSSGGRRRGRKSGGMARSGPLTRSASLRSLNSLPSPAHTPIKKRLRSNKYTPPEEEVEDGDDEDEQEHGSENEASEGDELEASENGDDEDEVEESVDLSGDDADEGEDEDENEPGRSVIVLDDDDDNDDQSEYQQEDSIVEVDRHGNPIELVSDGSDDEVEVIEPDEGDKTETGEVDEMEEDEEDTDYIDLAEATVKSLTRLKRDNLVQLCEARELDTSGTKPQLAQALLEWRDAHADDDTSSTSVTDSGSSGSTARPRTSRKLRNRHAVNNGVPETPILLRSEHVHVEQPATPPVSHGATPVINVQHATPVPASQEPELDLDLEELGLEEKEIPPDKLTKLEKIGSGGFKDVFVGKYRGRKVALAEIRGQLTEMDIKELTLLRDFDHPNIVKFLGVSVPENTRETPVMIISELCANGDLYDYIRNVPPPPLKKVITIMIDIANGLRYLHERKPAVIHRDCKSSNILITTAVRAKIADFGLAKVKQSTRSMIRSVVGTVNWQAPELWHPHPKYDFKVDVFSCAMVFWEILQWHNPNKKYPWEGMNEHAIYDVVGQKRQRPSTSGLRKQWKPALVDLVERMWAHEPKERPTMAEVHDELQRILSEV